MIVIDSITTYIKYITWLLLVIEIWQTYLSSGKVELRSYGLVLRYSLAKCTH